MTKLRERHPVGLVHSISHQLSKCLVVVVTRSELKSLIEEAPIMTSNKDVEKSSVLDLTKSARMTSLEWQNLMEEMQAINNATNTETFKERAIRKSKEQPLVPIGCLATVGCLTMGLFSLYKGDQIKQQRFMRGRVLAQGFTIAVVAVALISSVAGDKLPVNK